MRAQDLSFTSLINIKQGAREHFHVPKYQREYTWRKAQWEQLITDIEDNESGYFMGSIICVCDAEELANGTEILFEVVDGQQRLTTLSLLLLAIHSSLAATLEGELLGRADQEDVRTCLGELRSTLVKRKRGGHRSEPGSFLVGNEVYFLRVQPSAQNHNLEDYRFLLTEAGVLEAQPKPANFGNRLLGKAYAYFQSRLPTKLPALLQLMDKLNQLQFVQITVNSQADAYALFESLNNRGLPLSAIDIIKNKMLAQMEKKHRVNIDESFERWQGIVKAVPEVQEQERFLRHFYNAFKHRKEIRVDKVPRATRSLIIKIFESLIKRDAAGVFQTLANAADTYGTLLRADYRPRQLENNLRELGRIGSAPVYQLLLYLFTLEPRQLEGEKFLLQAVDLLRRFFIRRNVTDKPPTRQIDQGLIDLIESCAARSKAGHPLAFPWFVEELMRCIKPASLEEFRTALGGDLYENNGLMARYLLIQVDQLHHTREYQPDLWARDDKNRFVWTVEHILPQTDKLPAHWVTMIAQGDRKAAAECQAQHVHRLGNLTLSGYNSDLATAAFSKKQKLAKDRSFLGQRINIGYKNGLALNLMTFDHEGYSYALADAPCWDADLIEARTQALVTILLKANLLPGEKLKTY